MMDAEEGAAPTAETARVEDPCRSGPISEVPAPELLFVLRQFGVDFSAAMRGDSAQWAEDLEAAEAFLCIWRDAAALG